MKYKFEDGIFDIEPTPWRESGFDFNLDINGMQVITDDYDFDYFSTESLRKRFTKVAHDFFPKDTKSFCFPRMVRRPKIKTTRYIHADFWKHFKINEDHPLTEQFCPEYKSEDWFRMTGFWVNGGSKNTNAPLIMADLQTVDMSFFEKAVDKEMPIYNWSKSLFPYYDDKVSWYSFDDLEPNEILLIKHFNRFDEKHCTFHGGPVIIDESKPQRVSCDVRVITLKKIKNSS